MHWDQELGGFYGKSAGFGLAFFAKAEYLCIMEFQKNKVQHH